MKTVFADKHVLHNPHHEIMRGKVIGCFDKTDRGENIHKALVAAKLGEILAPTPFSMDYIKRIHTGDYIAFLQNASKEWAAQNYEGDVFGTSFNMQHTIGQPPRVIEGKAGFYLSDLSLAITPGTWEALEQSVHTALSAFELVMKGESSAFALCRPPGHHATGGVASGYCFLNNAAIVAQAYLDKGFKKVAILDGDDHHGNGTQEIFYNRNDLQVCNLHGDPTVEFPYFVGYADERGAGAGEGYNHNYPQPMGTQWEAYKDSLRSAAKHIAAYGADLLIVSLGVDTYEADPISGLKLKTSDFLKLGEEIASLKMPTLFIMEGGYAIDAIGDNVGNVLKGFLS